MRKTAFLGASALVVFCILADPYGLSMNATDLRSPGAPWQIGATLCDVGMVTVYAIGIFRDNNRLALLALGSSSLFNLAVNVLLVRRDGVDRFTMEFGLREFLSIYLICVGLRIMLLVATSLSSLSTRDY